MTKKALIIGATGQDGAYLTQLLLQEGFVVHCLSRNVERAGRFRLQALGVNCVILIHNVDPLNRNELYAVLQKIQPDQVYNLSGQSSVGLSFTKPAETIESHVIVTLNLLEILRTNFPYIKLFNAGSSECFGDTNGAPASEETPFRPRSPYGVAKTAAVQLVSSYRESYGFFACSGILFNHESPLRSPNFVTRKITKTAVRIAAGEDERLCLGDISISRDWGWAPDVVRAIYLMMQQDKADDFVVATGKSHPLESFVSKAFEIVGLDWQDHVDFDPLFKRPSEIAYSVGDASKARDILGWTPTVDFCDIVERLVLAEQANSGTITRC